MSAVPDYSNNFKRLQARLRSLAGKAIEDFRMIEAGDRVMGIKRAMLREPTGSPVAR